MVEQRPHVELGAGRRLGQIVGRNPLDLPGGEACRALDTFDRIHVSLPFSVVVSMRAQR